jgi:hypothetical protein
MSPRKCVEVHRVNGMSGAMSGAPARRALADERDHRIDTTGETLEHVEAQIDLHRALQQQRKKILAEISLTSLDLEAARFQFESAESRLSSVRARDRDLLRQLQSITLDIWRLEWKLGHAVVAHDRSSPDHGRATPSASQYDQDIVLHDYQGDVPPGTIGTFFILEGNE